MNRFESGSKRDYYGKGDVIVYRLAREAAGSTHGSPVFGASVLMLVYGNAFWPTYTRGDNSTLIATDSMKNFIQRETMNFEGGDLEGFCRFLGERFIAKYQQVEGVQVSADEIPYTGVDGDVAFTPIGPERGYARIEMTKGGLVDAVSAINNFKLLRLGGSAFKGFVRDEYTTLPDLENRPLHMWLDVEWSYSDLKSAFSAGAVSGRVRALVREVFRRFESGSIQQMIYQMGTRILADIPAISEIRLEANNRTWDTIAERGQELGVYTDARPPYGCLGLRLRREDL